MVNGWKNSGAPWTYKPDVERVKLENGEEVVAGKQ